MPPIGSHLLGSKGKLDKHIGLAKFEVTEVLLQTFLARKNKCLMVIVNQLLGKKTVFVVCFDQEFTVAFFSACIMRGHIIRIEES